MRVSPGSDTGCVELSAGWQLKPFDRRVGPGWSNPPTSEDKPELLRSNLTQKEHLGLLHRGHHAEGPLQWWACQPRPGQSL